MSEREKEESRDMPFCRGQASEIKSFVFVQVHEAFLKTQFILGTVTSEVIQDLNHWSKMQWEERGSEHTFLVLVRSPRWHVIKPEGLNGLGCQNPGRSQLLFPITLAMLWSELATLDAAL